MDIFLPTEIGIIQVHEYAKFSTNYSITGCLHTWQFDTILILHTQISVKGEVTLVCLTPLKLECLETS